MNVCFAMTILQFLYNFDSIQIISQATPEKNPKLDLLTSNKRLLYKYVLFYLM